MDDTNSLIEQRKAKLAALRAKGIDPFKNKFTPGETCLHAREHYAEGREVALAGRITAHRDMGKSMFIDLRDQSGRIQIYAQKNVLGDEQFDIFQASRPRGFHRREGHAYLPPRRMKFPSKSPASPSSPRRCVRRRPSGTGLKTRKSATASVISI